MLEPFKSSSYRIGACDWSLGKDSDPGAFAIAKEIGLDGILVNVGNLKNNLHLRDQALQQEWLKASHETGVAISSIALADLNYVPYKSDPRTIEWVWDSIEVARNLGVSVILLAFFIKNDLRNDPEGTKETIRRLKMATPRAEKMGITLGIESYLNAEQHLEIIQQVGSPNLRVYMDFRNTADAGYDVIKEIKILGKENLCEFHMKENGSLLGNGTMDWRKIGDTLNEMGYKGDKWMQIEGAMPKDAALVESYRHNLEFLRTIFPKKKA
jgi:sugar phosphate isomerase/epimerase